MEQKYRVHEFAKDFGLKSVEVMELLTRFETKERTHMAVLTQGELDFLFNHYTKKNQVENFNAYFELANRPDPEGTKKAEAPKKAEEPKKVEEPKKAEEPKQTGPRLIEKAPQKAEEPKKAGPRLIEKAPQKAETPKKTGPRLIEKAPQKPAEKPAPKQPEKAAQKQPVNNTQPFTKKKEKGPKQVQNYERTVRVVDTRTQDVNLGKYDDKLLDLAGSHESRNMTSSKQKFQKKKDYQKKGQFGTKKKKETEQERLERISRERKQAKMKILVPDEISVGDLAMMMKVNVAQVVKKLMEWVFWLRPPRSSTLIPPTSLPRSLT